tara:strand:+ start:31772 stop:31990 length:219 start_codon:yes stop_codon:yes gene_type:complete
MMPYTDFGGENSKEQTIVHVSAHYQPDPNTSGYNHCFTYNRLTDVVTSNIGNGDVSEEDAQKIKQIIKSKTK